MEAPTVQLNDIALFVEVAKRKSFSLARALDMPTSTLSRRINELERAIGLRLINRNTRRLDLTEAGAAMRRCQGLIDEARLATSSCWRWPAARPATCACPCLTAWRSGCCPRSSTISPSAIRTSNASSTSAC